MDQYLGIIGEIIWAFIREVLALQLFFFDEGYLHILLLERVAHN